jgi:two-component sensor histidine kinase
MGYNMYSDSTRRSVINRAIRTGQIAFSPPVELIRQAGGGTGFLAIKSVNYPGSKEVKGIVLCIYRMDVFIEKTLASELKILEIGIYDKAAGNTMLYSNNKEDTGFYSDEYSNITAIEAGDRQWIVTFHPLPKYLSFPHAFESYVALFLTLVATFLLIAIVKKRDDYNTTLEQKVGLRTAELQESNILKENLLREIHHRVKNNLQITSSLMNMQKRKLTSQEAIKALENSQSRISAIALTHQKIYQDKDSKAVNLSEYLTDLMAYQKRLAPSVQYTIQCPDTSIDLDRAVPLALIISELVTNALKHAYDDSLENNELIIQAKDLTDDRILLTISDNGHGLPPNFNIKNAKGIGFEIIQSLCRQISADLSYESNEKGTIFKIIFSNKAKAVQGPPFT